MNMIKCLSLLSVTSVILFLMKKPPFLFFKVHVLLVENPVGEQKDATQVIFLSVGMEFFPTVATILDKLFLQQIAVKEHCVLVVQ